MSFEDRYGDVGSESEALFAAAERRMAELRNAGIDIFAGYRKPKNLIESGLQIEAKDMKPSLS